MTPKLFKSYRILEKDAGFRIFYEANENGKRINGKTEIVEIGKTGMGIGVLLH